MTTENAVGYARISMEDQSRTSLEDQPIEIKDYCDRNKLTLAHVFIENGKSAFTFQRPQWLKLEDYIRANKNIKYIIVKHIDRFSRADLVDALIKIREIEEKLGVKILSITDSINRDSNEFGNKILRTFELLMSNNELNRIRKRTKDGIYRTLANGRWPRIAPYGYVNDRDAAGLPILNIVDHEAIKIRQAFKLFSEGVNAFEIRRILGFTGKSRSFVQEILKRSLYAGIMQVPEHNGKPAYETNSVNPPLISKALFQQVQSMMVHKGNKYHGNDDVWMRGVLKCNVCGKMMTAGKSKGYSSYYWYYKCGTHRKNIPAKLVHEKYMELLKVFNLDLESIDRIKQSLVFRHEETRKNRGGDFMRLKIDLEKIKKKISSVQERFLMAGDIDNSIYQKSIADLKERESILQEQISGLYNDDSDIISRVDEVLIMLVDLPKTFSEMPTHIKQKFILVQLGSSASFTGQLFESDYIHPLFASKVKLAEDLGLLKIKTSTEKISEGLLGTGEQTIGQLLDFIFMAV